MSEVTDLPMNLMSFWRRHRDEMRPVGQIVSEARAGLLPGVEPLESGFGFRVIDEVAALAAMRKFNDLVVENKDVTFQRVPLYAPREGADGLWHAERGIFPRTGRTRSSACPPLR